MALLDWIGYAAASCTTAAFVPQVLRVWRTRSTADISLKMFLVLVAGLCLWLASGQWKDERNPTAGPAFTRPFRHGARMALLEWTGYAAAFCTTVAFVPQVLRVWRTRSTEDISLKMFLVLVAGLCLWVVYGLARGEAPIVAANGLTLVLAGTILFFKLRHG